MWKLESGEFFPRGSEDTGTLVFVLARSCLAEEI